MNNIKATIVADSINDKGDRITSMLVTYPRIIHSEIMTHRLFSRNSASSRAIPFEKMIESVKNNPFIPIAWQKEHKGMQGSEYITNIREVAMAYNSWINGRDNAIISAEKLNSAGVTKQLCNRLLEPFMYHTVLITATHWSNFFELRCPKYRWDDKIFKSKKECYKYGDIEIAFPYEGNDWMGEFNELPKYSDSIEWFQMNEGQSEIHMMDLAEKMYDAINESTPKLLKEGEWHIPFGDNIDTIQLQNLYKKYKASGYNPDNPTPDEYYYEGLDDLEIKIAIARCARTSYTVFGEEKSDNYEADLKLFDKLKESGHFSPFEHISRCMSMEEYYHCIKGFRLENTKYDTPKWKEEDYGWCNNFKGFIQYRYLLENNLI